LKVLITVLFPNIRSPLSKHTPWLIDALRSSDCLVETEPWGAHNNNESFREKVVGRFRDVVRIRRRLRKERFDALLLKTAHDWNTLTRDILLLALTGSHVPITAVLFHGSRSDWLVGKNHLFFKLATRVLLRLADVVLLLSKEELNEWRLFNPRVNAYWVSNPFVSRQNISPKSTLAQGAKLNGRPVLLFVSRLMVEKGIFELLEATAIVTKTTPCHLCVVGDGPERQRVEERICQLGLQRDVTLRGYLSGSELDQAYRGADAFVLPTFWAEGFPTVITEAMDAGLPIVTTKTRGARDHLLEGRNALFVPAKDPAALAAALLRIIADRTLRAEMSIANRTDVEKFRPDRVASEYVRIIRDTVVRQKS
jgi:glycosyltransferase involved in cell wall biosynthesis